ncbi:MAG: hypothetical protein QM757_42180 [Paludibaculum sp.]
MRPCSLPLRATLAALALSAIAHAAGKPEDDLAAVIRAFYAKSFTGDWSSVESLPGVQWAPLPPTALQNCLPDGGCFTRQGRAVIGGRNLVVIATGARQMVNNLYLRNGTAPFGEAAVLAALQSLKFTAALARCPVPGTTGGTNWYRLTSPATNPGVLSVQSSCNGRPCEGFVLTQGQELPALQPAQLKLYSEQCSAPPAERKAVSTALPHEALAQSIAALIPPATGPALSGWKDLAAQPSEIKWPATAPLKMDLSFKNDPNPFAQSAELALAGRKFSILASGSTTQPKVVYFEEMGLHPRGENLLAVLYAKGLAVQLARCGPVYTESTNNWYSLKSANTQPVMLRQSIRYEGNQVQDTYELRLDNTLPKRDPRDRDPGVAGCR